MKYTTIDYNPKKNWHWGDVSEFFSPEEVMSPETISNLHLLDINALYQLNQFRRFVGEPLYVNHRGLFLRGVRSASEQLSLKSIGGASNSQHVQGKAFDISCYELDFEVFVRKARTFWPFVKSYPTKNFVHCDNRNLVTL